MDESEHYCLDHILQLGLVISKLHVFLAFAAGIDIPHKLIAVTVDFQKVVEDLHRCQLIEDPSLLDLEYDPLEEYGAGFQQEWILRVLRLVFDYHQVFLNDFVLKQHAKVGQEVELPLRVLLDFHLFLLEFVVGVRRSFLVRRLLVFVDELVQVVSILIFALRVLLLCCVALLLSERYFDLLDLSLLLLVADHQDLALAVLLKHLKHQVGELDRVVKELCVVELWIVKFERDSSDDAEILVEHIGLQYLGILYVLFVVRAGHVADDVKELRHVLQRTVELAISHLSLLELPSIKLAVYHVEILELQARTDAIDLDRKGHPLNLQLRLSFLSQLFALLLLNEEHTQVLFHFCFTILLYLL